MRLGDFSAKVSGLYNEFAAIFEHIGSRTDPNGCFLCILFLPSDRESVYSGWNTSSRAMVDKNLLVYVGFIAVYPGDS